MTRREQRIHQFLSRRRHACRACSSRFFSLTASPDESSDLGQNLLQQTDRQGMGRTRRTGILLSRVPGSLVSEGRDNRAASLSEDGWSFWDRPRAATANYKFFVIVASSWVCLSISLVDETSHIVRLDIRFQPTPFVR